jgi:hypothetical protein
MSTTSPQSFFLWGTFIGGSAGAGYSVYTVMTLPAAELSLDALALPFVGIAEGMAIGGPAGIAAYGTYKLFNNASTGLSNWFNQISNSFVQGLIQNTQNPITGSGN